MLSTAPIVPAAQPTTSAHNAIRQQLVAAGASEQFIKLVTGEYENLSLPVAIPDFGLRKFNPAPAVNTAAGNTLAGSSGGIGSTNNPNLPQQGTNGAAASSAPNNQPAGNTINQPAAGARTTQPVPSEDKKAASTSWLGACRNRTLMWLGIAGIAGLAVIGTFLGSKSRFRSSSEPSSKPATAKLVTGKNAPLPGFTLGSNMTTNIFTGTNLPPIPSAQSGATNTVTPPSTNTPPTSPTNSVAEATSPTNTVAKASAPENSGNMSSTESAEASAADSWANLWPDSDLFNILEGSTTDASVAAPQTASTNAPSASASTSAAQKPAEPKPLVNDFSKHSNEELNKLASEFRSVALKALPNIAEGQQHAPEDLAKAQAAAELAAAQRGLDLLALEDTIRGRAAAERYKALSNQDLDKIFQQYNEVFEILTKTWPNDEAKVRTEVAKAAAKKGDHLGALIAEVQARNAKADAAAQQATTPQVTPTGANASQTNSAPKTAVAPARTGAATSTPGAVPGDTLPGHSFKLPAIKLTPLAERPAPPPAVGSPRAMATHPQMFTPSANDNRFNHRGELAQLKQMIDSYETAAKVSPGINPNDRKAVWDKAVALAAGNNVNLDEASRALNLAQVNMSPAKSVRLADPHVPPTEGLVLNDAGWRGPFGLRRTTVLQSTDGAPLVVQKKGLFGTSTYSTPGISQEEARELLTRANGSSTKTSS